MEVKNAKGDDDHGWMEMMEWVDEMIGSVWVSARKSGT
jgi:hypothetical protein